MFLNDVTTLEIKCVDRYGIGDKCNEINIFSPL